VIAAETRPAYTSLIGRAGVPFARPRVRSVFSVSAKVFQSGNGGPPGGYAGEAGWRAITRILRSYSAARSAIETTLADLTNVVLPTECLLCDAPLVSLSATRVCGDCIARVGASQDAEDKLCARCGDALGMESARFAAALGIDECTMCRLAPPEFSKAVAFAPYDNEMREMLHLLKFAGRRRMAKHLLGERLALAMLKLRHFAADDLLVLPVPLFAARERERGFNQARLLAEAAVRSLRRSTPGWKLILRDDVLLRVKDTRALYRLNPTQRRNSLRGAFQVAASKRSVLSGREVLLVDDIMTTGATARTCARVLLRAGASRVWAATVAKAQPERLRTPDQQGPVDVAFWTAPPRPLEPDIGRRITF
jgi:ComF family protein